MRFQRWSLGRLILAVVAWLLLSPILLLGVLLAVGGNLGFTVIPLLVLALLWFGPAVWLVARWRSARS